MLRSLPLSAGLVTYRAGDGPVVDALLSGGVIVVVISPNHVLADTPRTDWARLRPLTLDSPATIQEAPRAVRPRAIINDASTPAGSWPAISGTTLTDPTCVGLLVFGSASGRFRATTEAHPPLRRLTHHLGRVTVLQTSDCLLSEAFGASVPGSARPEGPRT
jgi:hypothetical protein